MQNIVVIGFPKALSSAITGVVDLLALAGVTWNSIQGQDPERYFNVRIATVDGKPVKCINGIEIAAHMSFDDIRHADAIVVPTIGGPIKEILTSDNTTIRQTMSMLQRADRAGWVICGNCTGNFLLAEAGILDGRSATTHWGYKDLFEQRYPNVQLHADQLITRDDNVYCAGGGLAWLDLALHLIERTVGFEVAMQTAKAFVVDYRRDSQLTYLSLIHI